MPWWRSKNQNVGKNLMNEIILRRTCIFSSLYILIYILFFLISLKFYKLKQLFSSLYAFHTNPNWQFFTGVWVKASLQDSSQYPSQFWMISIFPLIFSSLNLFPRFSETVSRVPTMTGITIIFMFYSFFSSTHWPSG